MLFRDLMTNGWSAGYMDTLDGSHFRTISGAWRIMENHFSEASWKLIPDCDCLIVVSADPYQSQPIISSLIRKSVLETGTKLIVIGQENPLQLWSSFHFPVKNGDEVQLIKALWAEAISSIKPPPHIKNWKVASKEAEGVDISKLIKKIGLSEKMKEAFREAATIFARSINPMFIAGAGLTGQEEPYGLRELMKLAELKDLLPGDTLRLIILKPNGNSTGAWILKLSSDNIISNHNKLKGGLILLGGEDTSKIQVLDRLNGLDFLAVLSPYFPEALADKADVLIPKPLWMEENGSYTSLDGLAVRLKKRALHPPEGVKETWRTMIELANRTKFRPSYATWNELVEQALDEMKLLVVNRT
ncbi:MAG: molybdopterin-dependent oxidoreductase [Deltaproteobacteria bacterium]|nr:molybdopterin-dependent oxidoreductase [Deltaproteobacteria bacterium]